MDDKQWSELWQKYICNAKLFNPSETLEICCLIPVPEKEETLIISTDGLAISDESTLSILHRYAEAHCFPEYPIITHSLKRLNLFGQYKLPWFCPFFALFPLESTNQTIWLNPLKIRDIYKHNNQYYAEMLDGPTLLLPLSKRRITKHAEIASLLLATISRGNFHLIRSGTTPLDYLDLPNTPFSNYLSKRPLLQKFSTPIGKLRKHYQISYALYHCPDSIEESKGDYEDGWL